MPSARCRPRYRIAGNCSYCRLRPEPGAGSGRPRRLDRASSSTLLLDGASFDEAVDALKDAIAEIREEAALAPATRAGLDGSAATWVHEYRASPRAARLVVNAMARYILHLQSGGTSPRTLSGVRSDLEAAGLLVFMYLAPRASEALACFSDVPCELEFARKFAGSPVQSARYRRSLEGFARFLRETGMIPDEEDE